MRPSSLVVEILDIQKQNSHRIRPEGANAGRQVSHWGALRAPAGLVQGVLRARWDGRGGYWVTTVKINVLESERAARSDVTY